MTKEKKVKDIISKQFEVKKFLSAMYRDNGIDFTKEKIRILEADGDYKKVSFFPCILGSKWYFSTFIETGTSSLN